MRANMWSQVLVVLSLFSFPVLAEAPEPGTRVAIALVASSGEMPDPEKLVESLKAVGGEFQVRVIRHKSPDQEALTLDLWGNTVPPADIPQTLRETFPVLGSADIQVSTLDANERPKRDADCDLEKLAPGEKGQVKKVVKIIKKKE